MMDAKSVESRLRSTTRGGRLVIAFFLVVSLGTASMVAAGKGKLRDPHDLVNIYLSPTYSQWLVGATGELASDAEVEEFLALRDDDRAERFVEAFWDARRDLEVDGGEESSMRAAMGLVQNPFRALYETRAEEADKLFSESGYLGRRTARGTIFVLFGEPEETDYEVNPDPEGQPIVVWTYEKKRRGLDGRKAERIYRFIRQGDLTVPYVPGRVRPVRSRF